MRIFEHELKSKEGINAAIDPLIDFNMRLTRSVHMRLCLSMYEKDKMMLSFTMANKEMKKKFKYENPHLEFIIKGPYS
jgi:hypothetical protein